MRTLAAAALLALALTGCSDDESSDAATTPSTPVDTTQIPTVSPPSSVAMPDPPSEEMTSNQDLVDTHPIAFASYSVTGDAGDRVAVHFDSGAPECFGAAATVTETEASVTIALRTGTLPAAVGKACTMQVVPATLEVELDAPLGDRQVVSG
ncbi:hypothetical protein [Rhodococcus gannanensis]|uniref:Lipoprotein n=1 Tax=Rhodococcus gannanensis TaxID=1960308 RepID=A0ABW4NXL3_9NOCA